MMAKVFPTNSSSRFVFVFVQFFFYDTKMFKSFYDGPHKFIVLKIKLFALMFTIKIIVTY